eukprot:TRINITY_DN18925_c0_g1_i1.p1 TRINITY_DN18925_c0_g1~~TRINITY_DN18925_c0_g1_i1.p1  ORF type:complete len:750 (+),score=93.11 TRINITY_DN18925_c0_g1_i1:41-2290(+)
MAGSYQYYDAFDPPVTAQPKSSQYVTNPYEAASLSHRSGYPQWANPNPQLRANATVEGTANSYMGSADRSYTVTYPTPRAPVSLQGTFSSAAGNPYLLQRAPPPIKVPPKPAGSFPTQPLVPAVSVPAKQANPQHPLSAASRQSQPPAWPASSSPAPAPASGGGRQQPLASSVAAAAFKAPVRNPPPIPRSNPPYQPRPQEPLSHPRSARPRIRPRPEPPREAFTPQPSFVPVRHRAPQQNAQPKNPSELIQRSQSALLKKQEVAAQQALIAQQQAQRDYADKAKAPAPEPQKKPVKPEDQPPQKQQPPLQQEKPGAAEKQPLYLGKSFGPLRVRPACFVERLAKLRSWDIATVQRSEAELCQRLSDWQLPRDLVFVNCHWADTAFPKQLPLSPGIQIDASAKKVVSEPWQPDEAARCFAFVLIQTKLTDADPAHHSVGFLGYRNMKTGVVALPGGPLTGDDGDPSDLESFRNAARRLCDALGLSDVAPSPFHEFLEVCYDKMSQDRTVVFVAELPAGGQLIPPSLVHEHEISCTEWVTEEVPLTEDEKAEMLRSRAQKLEAEREVAQRYLPGEREQDREERLAVFEEKLRKRASQPTPDTKTVSVQVPRTREVSEVQLQPELVPLSSSSRPPAKWLGPAHFVTHFVAHNVDEMLRGDALTTLMPVFASYEQPTTPPTDEPEAKRRRRGPDAPISKLMQIPAAEDVLCRLRFLQSRIPDIARLEEHLFAVSTTCAREVKDVLGRFAEQS